MNPPAIALYRDHRIDLETEMLEIRVCAQHHNGGIAVDADWQTSIPGLYAAEEAAGTFGAYRPGGTALNSAQVGALRSAFHIARSEHPAPPPVEKLLPLAEKALDGLNFPGSVAQTGLYMREQMSLYGAHLRDLAELERLAKQIDGVQAQAAGSLRMTDDMEARLRLRDQLTTRSLSSAPCSAPQGPPVRAEPSLKGWAFRCCPTATTTKMKRHGTNSSAKADAWSAAGKE